MEDKSYFKTLTIESNDPGIDSGEWDKSEVLLELNELGFSHAYPGKTDWAKYIVDHVFDNVEDFDEQLIIAFFNSKLATELTLDFNGVEMVKIFKS